MAKVMGNVIKLHTVRLSFPDLFVPRAPKNGKGEPKFGATFLLDPKNPQHKETLKEIRAEVDRMVAEQWPKGKPPKLEVIFWGKGETKTNQESGEVYDGYHGMYFVTGKSNKNRAPRLMAYDAIDGKRTLVELSKDDPRIYGGVYCHATINLYIQDDENGKAIRCGLRGVISLGYGDPFGSSITEEEFKDFDAGDEDEFDGDDDGLD